MALKLHAAKLLMLPPVLSCHRFRWMTLLLYKGSQDHNRPLSLRSLHPLLPCWGPLVCVSVFGLLWNKATVSASAAWASCQLLTCRSFSLSVIATKIHLLTLTLLFYFPSFSSSSLRCVPSPTAPPNIYILISGYNQNRNYILNSLEYDFPLP